MKTLAFLILNLFTMTIYGQDPADNKTFIFYELSPQLFSHHIWRSLDQLWLEFINY